MLLTRSKPDANRAVLQTLAGGKQAIVAAEEPPRRNQRLAVELKLRRAASHLELERVLSLRGRRERALPGVLSGLETLRSDKVEGLFQGHGNTIKINAGNKRRCVPDAPGKGLKRAVLTEGSDRCTASASDHRDTRGWANHDQGAEIRLAEGKCLPLVAQENRARDGDLACDLGILWRDALQRRPGLGSAQ